MMWLLAASALALGTASPARRVTAATQRAVAPSPVWIPVATTFLAATVIAMDRVALVLSACVAGATAIKVIQLRQHAGISRRRLSATAVFVGHVATNLQAGATLVRATTRAAEHLPDNAPAQLRRDVRRMAGSVAAGSSAEAALANANSPELRELGVLWTLSSTRGLPVADLLTQARRRLDKQQRHRAATEAALAGPKTTATVLAALPLAGVAMGTAMGARPLTVLLSPGPGGWLLLTGTALVCAGVLVSTRIIEGALR
ncbi:type II secretion system F family protein [Corynebacterium mayonis]|uniref:type II secretion system F family protein n=1 Tax=Corynebacterium mayonis TaxID=3062461 RepID=UPI0031403D59